MYNLVPLYFAYVDALHSNASSYYYVRLQSLVSVIRYVTVNIDKMSKSSYINQTSYWIQRVSTEQSWKRSNIVQTAKCRLGQHGVYRQDNI